MTALIHSTAVIHPGAKLHPSVEVGPYAVIGEHVTIGADTTIGAHVVLDGHTEIGDRNRIFPGAVIGAESQDLKYDGSLNLVKIGNDNRIREYVTINRASHAEGATVIGDRNLLMAYVHVGHDCVIGNETTIANGVALAGHVHIESQARISGILGVHQFVHIGRLAMVGGMSRIDRDVPPFMLVEGNPCRVRSLNLVGLQRAGMGELADGQLMRYFKKAFRMLYRSDLTFDQALAELATLADYEPIQHLYQFLRESQAEGRRGSIPGMRPARSKSD
ncbi:MAG: acyl-ACP--UDP-N-acetylglucosamine O-acyltransferase [Thainema sp.]